MPRLISFLLFIIVINVYLVLGQQTLSKDEVIKNVQRKYGQMKDASASFTKKTNLRYGKKEQVISGSVKIKKGNKYRVVLPQQLLVTDGATVWVYSTESNLVLIDTFKEQKQNFSPDKFLTGLPDDFTVQSMKEENGTIILTLMPSKHTAQTAFVASLTLWIEQEQWLVNKIEYTDRNLSKVTIELSDISFNQGVGDAEFHFEPPAGAKVIDQRKSK